MKYFFSALKILQNTLGKIVFVTFKPFFPVLASKLYRVISGYWIYLNKAVTINKKRISKISDTKKNKLFIDCGVNTGFVLEKYQKALTKFKFEGFEIQKDIIKIARKSNPNAVIFNKAVATFEGHQEIFIPKSYGYNYKGGSTTIRNKYKDENLFEKQIVECIDFTNYLYEKKLSGYDFIVVKMDIEGAEYSIIDSLYKFFKKENIKLIDYLIIEFHPKTLRNIKNQDKYLKYLEKMDIEISKWV